MKSSTIAVASLGLAQRPPSSDVPAGHDPAPASSRLFTIRTAPSGPEREAARALLQHRYAWRGYRTVTLPADQTGHRTTLSAHDGDRTIGTLTLEIDGPSRLAADQAFADVLQPLRREGRRLAEFTRLATEADEGRLRVLAALFHVAYIVAYRIRRCDTLLLEVNPRHVRFYERMLGCRVIAPERLHEAAGAPAVLLSAPFSYIAAQLAALGGSHEMSCSSRSLYPLAFSSHDEEGILQRLMREQPAASPLEN